MIKRYKVDEIDKLVTILNNDGVISTPTDTVFGICAKINSEKAYKKMIEIKNRPTSKAFPIMCKDKKQIEEIAIINNNAKKIINKFMPGPITIILNKKDNLPDYIPNNTLAIRIAPTKELKTLIEKINSPIFMTSANKSNEPPCESLDEIEKNCPLLDGMLDGNIKYNEASTIIDCTENDIKIIRKGPITEEEIK